jgi:hypothetical protein
MNSEKMFDKICFWSECLKRLQGFNFTTCSTSHLEGAKNLIASIGPSSRSRVGNQQDPGRTVCAIRNFITRQIYLYVYWMHILASLHGERLTAI